MNYKLVFCGFLTSCVSILLFLRACRAPSIAAVISTIIIVCLSIYLLEKSGL